jgi:exosome complex component RRP40
VQVSLSLSRRLLRPDCAVLNALGRHLAYEIAVGMNGGVWFRSPGGALELVLLRNALLNSAQLTDLQAEAMVDQLVQISNKLSKR